MHQVVQCNSVSVSNGGGGDVESTALYMDTSAHDSQPLHACSQALHTRTQIETSITSHVFRYLFSLPFVAEFPYCSLRSCRSRSLPSDPLSAMSLPHSMHTHAHSLMKNAYPAASLHYWTKSGTTCLPTPTKDVHVVCVDARHFLQPCTTPISRSASGRWAGGIC